MSTLGTFRNTKQIEEAVLSVLRSGRLTYGPVTAEYERRFASMHGCAYGVATNSGTSSLQVTLQAMKELYLWPDRSEVIIPSTTFVATANAVIHCRLTPVLVDVDPIDYCIDPGKIEEKITYRTKAIIPVHAFGLPAQMTAINEIAKRFRL